MNDSCNSKFIIQNSLQTYLPRSSPPTSAGTALAVGAHSSIPELENRHESVVDSLIIDAVGAMGALGVALLMFIENVFPPIPSEVIMPLAGYLASQGELHLGAVILLGTIGAAAGVDQAA